MVQGEETLVDSQKIFDIFIRLERSLEAMVSQVSAILEIMREEEALLATKWHLHDLALMADKKSRLIDQLRILDQKRLQCVSEIKDFFGLPNTELSLRQLLPFAPEVLRPNLQSLGVTLELLIQRFTKLQEGQRGRLTSIISMIERTLAEISEHIQKDQKLTYGAGKGSHARHIYPAVKSEKV